MKSQLDGGAGELVPAHCGTAKRKVWLTPNLEQIAFLLPQKSLLHFLCKRLKANHIVILCGEAMTVVDGGLVF